MLSRGFRSHYLRKALSTFVATVVIYLAGRILGGALTALLCHSAVVEERVYG